MFHTMRRFDVKSFFLANDFRSLEYVQNSSPHLIQLHGICWTACCMTSTHAIFRSLLYLEGLPRKKGKKKDRPSERRGAARVRIAAAAQRTRSAARIAGSQSCAWLNFSKLVFAMFSPARIRFLHEWWCPRRRECVRQLFVCIEQHTESSYAQSSVVRALESCVEHFLR